MKTAKEACEEISLGEINAIISCVINYGGKYIFYNTSLDIGKNKAKLEELGYKVKLETDTLVLDYWPFFWKKPRVITNEYYVVSACCSEKV